MAFFAAASYSSLSALPFGRPSQAPVPKILDFLQLASRTMMINVADALLLAGKTPLPLLPFRLVQKAPLSQSHRSGLYTSVAVMPSVNTVYQYPTAPYEPDREPQPAFYRHRNGTQDGPLSPVTVKDFQEQQRPPARRPSTPNLGRSSPRLHSSPPPPVPDAQQRFKQHPTRDE